MDKHKIFLIIQSVLCILLAILAAAAIIGIYLEGAAVKAENPLEWIFTGEKIAERLRPIAPLYLMTLGLAVAGLVLNIKDENSEKPVKGGNVRCSTDPAQDMRSKARTVQLVLLLAALCLIIAGVFNGSARDVLGKAIKICTECVGLG